MASPQLSVVIVNYDSWADVARLSSALARASEVASGTCEVVVIDNASPGDRPSQLMPPPFGVRVIARPENGGFAAGVNAGWRAARGSWLLVLNPDVVAGPELIGQVLRRIASFARRPEAEVPGVVGFGLRNADGSRQLSVGVRPSLSRSVWELLIPRSRRKYQAEWRTRPGLVDWVTGACMLLNGRTLADVGGMDEDFFLYYEEVALCHAATRRGWRVEYDPTIEVVHLRPLQARRPTAALRVITRHSKLLYFRKHLPDWQFRVMAWVVSAEGRLRGLAARWRGRAEEARAWHTIVAIARALRGDDPRLWPRGTAVRRLAETVGQAETGTADAEVDPRHGSPPRPEPQHSSSLIADQRRSVRLEERSACR